MKTNAELGHQHTCLTKALWFLAVWVVLVPIVVTTTNCKGFGRVLLPHSTYMPPVGMTERIVVPDSSVCINIAVARAQLIDLGSHGIVSGNIGRFCRNSWEEDGNALLIRRLGSIGRNLWKRPAEYISLYIKPHMNSRTPPAIQQGQFGTKLIANLNIIDEVKPGYSNPSPLLGLQRFTHYHNGVLSGSGLFASGVGLLLSGAELLLDGPVVVDGIANGSRGITGLDVHLLPLEERHNRVSDYGSKGYQFGDTPLRVTLAALCLLMLEIGCQGWVKLYTDPSRQRRAWFFFLAGIGGFSLCIAVLIETFSYRYQGLADLTKSAFYLLKENANFWVQWTVPF